MDPGCDVMVAYKQNDRFLQPDHGFPIRMIIPGHIGEDLVTCLAVFRSCPGAPSRCVGDQKCLLGSLLSAVKVLMWTRTDPDSVV